MLCFFAAASCFAADYLAPKKIVPVGPPLPELRNDLQLIWADLFTTTNTKQSVAFKYTEDGSTYKMQKNVNGVHTDLNVNFVTETFVIPQDDVTSGTYKFGIITGLTKDTSYSIRIKSTKNGVNYYSDYTELTTSNSISSNIPSFTITRSGDYLQYKMNSVLSSTENIFFYTDTHPVTELRLFIDPSMGAPDCYLHESSGTDTHTGDFLQPSPCYYMCLYSNVGYAETAHSSI